ncbi:hypothetical protein [Ensifer canadensis]|uniref:hypothetical protein n=1 Tax=Ensifer canadensis TaxID=555315 RepID=UPI0035E3F2CA
MVDIRINQLPAEASPVATDVVPIDGATVGGATRKTTIQDLVLIGRPTASQAEAEAGTNPTKVMTPLTTKQSIASEVGVSLASAAQGLLADGAAQKAQNLSDLADIGTARLNIKVPTYAADRTTLKALDTTKDALVYLKEDGREGIFEWTAGNFSAQITADTQEGLYIKADAIASTAGAWVRIFDGVMKAKWFGISGGGSDETAKIQQASDFAPGRQLDFEWGKTYGITAITLKTGSKIRTNGANFRKIAASTTYAITLQDDVDFDYIFLSSPGAAADRGIRVIGNRARGKRLHAEADVATDGFGVRIEGTVLQSLTGLDINKISTKNFSSQTQVFYVDDSRIKKSIVDTYVTGLYIINVRNSMIDETYASGTHPSATGGAGNNAILVEATSDYGTDNVTIGKAVAKDSAEHALRVGGFFIIRDLLFLAASTYNTGCLAGSTGGASFKALLEVSNPGMHENIRVNSLYFEDCSNGTAGLANMAAVQMFRCKNSYVNNPVGRRKNNTYSCRLGLQYGSCDGVTISNPDIIDVEAIAINPLVPAGYPADMKDVVVQGGRVAVKASSVTTSPVLYANTTGIWTNISLRGVVVQEGRCYVRYDVPTGAGIYTDCVLEGEYKHGSGNSGAGGPIEGAANQILMNIKCPAYGSMSAKDGSIWQDTTNGLVKIRKAGVFNTL